MRTCKVHGLLLDSSRYCVLCHWAALSDAPPSEPIQEPAARLYRSSLGWRLDVDGIGYNAPTPEEAVAMASRCGAFEGAFGGVR